jgi:hypothetical protein
MNKESRELPLILAREFVGTDDSDVERVNFLKELGFSDIDALHNS